MRWLPKRWYFWAWGAIIFAAIILGYLIIPVQQRISQANCDRIQLGWSPEQVEDFLGERAHTGGWVRNDKVWQDEDGNAILVHFDERGIYDKTFLPSELFFSEKLKRRVERRIARLWPRFGNR